MAVIHIVWQLARWVQLYFRGLLGHVFFIRKTTILYSMRTLFGINPEI